MLKSYGIYNDVNKLPIFEKTLLSLPIDCDVAEIDTNDWSKWIIENYFFSIFQNRNYLFFETEKVLWNIFRRNCDLKHTVLRAQREKNDQICDKTFTVRYPEKT